MKALEILKEISTKCETDENFMGYTYDAKKVDKLIQEAIVELEEEQRLKQSVIEEIEYALLKPEYENVYLNNAIRFLKDNA